MKRTSLEDGKVKVRVPNGQFRRKNKARDGLQLKKKVVQTPTKVNGRTQSANPSNATVAAPVRKAAKQGSASQSLEAYLSGALERNSHSSFGNT